MAEKRKRRISKCECCPYFAKDYLSEFVEKKENQTQVKGKWICTRKSEVKKKSIYSDYTYNEQETTCVFDDRQKCYSQEKIKKDEEIKNTIIERWIRANE